MVKQDSPNPESGSKISRGQAGILLVVLSPLITFMGLPSLDGKIFPEWFPGKQIQNLLVVVGFVLFIIGVFLLLATVVQIIRDRARTIFES